MSKFGWSLPAGCWNSTLPGEEEEAPVIFSCPHCGAIDTQAWGEEQKLREQEYCEDGHASGVITWWQCPHCQNEIKSVDGDGFKPIFSDDLADQITDNLPEGWEVAAVHSEDWKQVQVECEREGKEVNFTLAIADNGQFCWEAIEAKLNQQL
jgi:endogenous inhibitor of DNA gyrase (YacG/DUF329 family)